MNHIKNRIEKDKKKVEESLELKQLKMAKAYRAEEDKKTWLIDDPAFIPLGEYQVWENDTDTGLFSLARFAPLGSSDADMYKDLLKYVETDSTIILKYYSSFYIFWLKIKRIFKLKFCKNHFIKDYKGANNRSAKVKVEKSNNLAY